MTAPRIGLRQALNDRQLLGNGLTGDSWKSWRVPLLAAMGEPLTADERALFKQLTQRDHEPHQRVAAFVSPTRATPHDFAWLGLRNIERPPRGGPSRFLFTASDWPPGYLDSNISTWNPF